MRAITVDRDHLLRCSSIAQDRELGPHDVRVTTGLVGVCATDREIVRTGTVFQVPDGDDTLVLGHEGSGRVIEVGGEVTDFRVGDCVVPIVTADRNRGIDSHGYFKESFVEDAEWLVRVPDSVADIAVLVEPITVTHHALREANALRATRTGIDFTANPAAASQTVLVVGAGPIGLLGAFLCRVWGYATTVVDVLPPDSKKANLARTAGCEYVSSPAIDDSQWRASEFDLILQTAPTPNPLMDYLPSLSHGGVFSLVGWQGQPHMISLDVARFIREAVHEEWAFVGTLGARVADFRGAVEAIGLMRQRFPLAISGVLTRVCTIDQYEEAFTHYPEDVAVAIDFGGGGLRDG